MMKAIVVFEDTWRTIGCERNGFEMHAFNNEHVHGRGVGSGRVEK